MSSYRTEWHVSHEDLTAYAAGATSEVLATSIEAHLMACATCRAGLARVSDPAEVDAAWERLVEGVDQPSRAPFGFARTAIATPALLRAALLAVVLIAVVPLFTALVAGDAGLVALLVLAPLAPMAAVTLAYRDWADPAGEITRATPAAGLRLVAARALAVSLAALPLAVAVLLIVETWVEVPTRAAFAWCLPGLALATLVLLAGTTRLDPLWVAGALAVGWTVTVLAEVTVRRSLRPEVLLDTIAVPTVQLAALAVAVVAVLLTVARRDAVAYRRIA